MPVITCSCCKRRSTQQLDIDMCNLCITLGDTERKADAVKMFLKKHPNSKMPEVARNLNIKNDDIQKMIDEGILLLVPNENGEMALDMEAEAKAQKKKELIQGLAASMTPAKPQGSRMSNDTRSQLLTDLKNKFDRGDR